MSRAEENAHWAAISFRRVLELGSEDLVPRDHLLASGVSRNRIDALYPLPPYAELLPHILAYLSANIGGWSATRANESDPLNFNGHKVEFEEALQADYSEQTILLFTSNQYGWRITNSALTELAPFSETNLRYLHSLLWHAWWAMSNRHRMSASAQEYADELMLATIEYVLPGLKVENQPRFSGFASMASEELY